MPAQTPEEINAAKAAHKKAKRARQAAAKAAKKKGDAFTPQSEYIPRAEREKQARLDRAAKRLAMASTVQTPPEWSIESIQKNKPQVYKSITTNPILTVNKHMHPQLIRAIWYLELDEKHNFNTSFKVTGANFVAAIMSMYIKKDNGMPDIDPPLLAPFAIACFEHRFWPDRFVDRANFIELWRNTPDEDDLHMSSQTQIRRVNRAASEMNKAIAAASTEDPESQAFTKMTRALDEAVDEEMSEELSQTGEMLFEKTRVDAEDMQSGHRKISFYKGENGIEEGLANKPEADRQAALRSWLDRVIETMIGQMKALKQRGDREMYKQFSAKLISLMRYETMRYNATKLGFPEFGWELPSKGGATTASPME